VSPRRKAPPQLSLFGASEPPPPSVAPAAAALAPLAQALPAGLRLGTSSWTFPGWSGLVWPDAPSEAKLAREGLPVYARHPLLRTVGIDRTFYAPVEASVLAGYAAQVPDDFRFLVKAHEACTIARWPSHPRYGAHRGQENDRFLDPAYATDRVVGPAMEGLGAKLGPILFQLPPGKGGPDFADRLHRFLEGLPRGPLYAVELRNGALLGPRYLEALAAAGAVHCLNVHPGMAPLAEQLRRVDPLHGPAVVVRWMLHDGLTYESAVAKYGPFSALVDEAPDVRQTIAQLAVAAAHTGVPMWIIVNNKAEGSAPLSIAQLARAIAALREGQTAGQR
jgi:uncharacterized protein YecE (DUF72 family)